ncbi:MAG: hypothetical protein N4A74_11170, partial [Carboxylicivirga sp.]|nr:hypothetical protein [Carboxylicivirga sp.]
SRYVKTFNNFHTFFSLGMGVSYIINEKQKLNYNSRSAKVEVKGKNISNNFALLSSPTFVFSYGTGFDKGLLGLIRAYWVLAKKRDLASISHTICLHLI